MTVVLRNSLSWSLCLALLLLSSAGFAETKKKKKKKKKKVTTEEVAPEESTDASGATPKKSMGALAGVGLFSLTPKPEGDSEKVTYSGFALNGLFRYHVRPTPSLLISPAAGLRIANGSFSKESVQASLSLTNLVFEGAAVYFFTPSIGAGLALNYDMNVSGSVSTKVVIGEEELSATGKIKTFSYLAFGPRFVYQLSDTLGFGGEYMMGSGSIAVQYEGIDSSEAVSYTSTVLGGFITYDF